MGDGICWDREGVNGFCRGERDGVSLVISSGLDWLLNAIVDNWGVNEFCRSKRGDGVFTDSGSGLGTPNVAVACSCSFCLDGGGVGGG